MRKFNFNLVCVVLAFLLFTLGCNNSTSSSYKIIEFDLSDSSKFSKDKLLHSFSKISFVALKDNPYKSINQLIKIEKVGNRFFLIDKHKNFFVYDTCGNFINFFGEKKIKLYNLGVLHDFCIFEDEIYFLGYKKILVTGLNLNVVREVNIEDLGLFPDSFIITKGGAVFFEQSLIDKESFFVYCDSNYDIVEKSKYYTRLPEFIRFSRFNNSVIFPYISENLRFNIVSFENSLVVNSYKLDLKTFTTVSQNDHIVQLEDIFYSDSINFGLFKMNESLYQFLMVRKDCYIWNCINQSLIQPFGYLNIVDGKILSSRPAFKFLELYNSYVNIYGKYKIELNFSIDSISSLSNPIIFTYEFQ